MASLSRRMFLVRSTMVAAAAGVASSVPGLSTIIGSAAPEVPAADATAADALSSDGIGAANAGEPLVAHVRDLSTGEIGVFNGTREVVVRDPELASRIFRAAR